MPTIEMSSNIPYTKYVYSTCLLLLSCLASDDELVVDQIIHVVKVINIDKNPRKKTSLSHPFAPMCGSSH